MAPSGEIIYTLKLLSPVIAFTTIEVYSSTGTTYLGKYKYRKIVQQSSFSKSGDDLVARNIMAATDNDDPQEVLFRFLDGTTVVLEYIDNSPFGDGSRSIEIVTSTQENLLSQITLKDGSVLVIKDKNARETIASYGDIVSHNASEFATSAQGLKANTAIQPNDNITKLNNNAGYITNNALTGYATQTWVGQQGYLTLGTLPIYDGGVE